MIWALMGGTTAVGMEMLYRKGLLGWTMPHVLMVIPLALAVNFCVWKMLTSPGPFLGALVWFSMTTAVVRVTAAYTVFHDPVDPKTIAAAVALLFASGLKFL